MLKNNTDCKNAALCIKLMPKLQSIEEKCDRILYELSLIEKMIASSENDDVDSLIASLRECACDMLKQSIEHREYVERCTDTPLMYMKRG